MIVRVHEDITTHENKVMGNFTARQALCGAIALLVIAGAFTGVMSLINSLDIAALLACTLGIPIFLCAIVKRDGLYFEKIMLEKIKEKIHYKRCRPFIMQNLYEDLHNLTGEEKEVESKSKKFEKRKEVKASRNNSTMAKKKYRSGKRTL